MGYRIQRRQGRGKQKRYVYTYPAKKALASIVDKVRALTRRRHTNPSLEVLLHRLNPVLRGWTNYCVSRGHARSDQRRWVPMN